MNQEILHSGILNLEYSYSYGVARKYVGDKKIPQLF